MLWKCDVHIITCSKKFRSTFLNASDSGSFMSSVNVPSIVTVPGNSVAPDTSLLLPLPLPPVSERENKVWAEWKQCRFCTYISKRDSYRDIRNFTWVSAVSAFRMPGFFEAFSWYVEKAPDFYRPQHREGGRVSPVPASGIHPTVMLSCLICLMNKNIKTLTTMTRRDP